MEENSKEDIEQLLVKYYDGELSSEEKDYVEKWIDLSDENRRIARQIEMICLAADTLDVVKKADTDKALHNVKKRIYLNKLNKALSWGERIAAILAIPLAVILFFLLSDNADEEVRMVEARTNPGMTTVLKLSDGTRVHLNSESVLEYPERFSGDERSVRLEGEAFFEVAPNKEKRFIVETFSNAKVEVLGTSFNIEAYQIDSTISTTLLTGKLLFSSKKTQRKIYPGQKLIYHIPNEEIKLIHTNGVTETAWKDGKVVFDNTPFREALHILSKRYNVNFIVSANKYDDDLFTGTFTGQHLDQILNVFNASTGIKWRSLPTESDTSEVNYIKIY